MIVSKMLQRFNFRSHFLLQNIQLELGSACRHSGEGMGSDAVKNMDLVDDFGRHRKRRPAVPVEATTRVETKKKYPPWALPVGRRAMAPVVLVAMELSCSS